MDPTEIGRLFRAACLAELDALKPGNVHVYADGHGMTVADFTASAEAVAPVMADPALTVGERILQSVQRTRAVVDCNTNLGIVLLCAPLANAALSGNGGDLRDRLRGVLEGLDIADAEHAFRAIVLADPAGLGDAEAHDVRAPAEVTLGQAMAAAAERDRIAWQYATAYQDVFELGLPRLREGLTRWGSETWATAAVFLGFLARFPDTHIVREHGPGPAETVRLRAEPFERELLAAAAPEDMAPALLAFDAELKAQGLNPGTSADLTVASLFARGLQDAKDPG